MRLEFLPSAVNDFARLREFVEPKNPEAAARIVARLYGAAAMLLTTPELGRPVPGTKYRKLVIRMRRSSYVMRYRLSSDAVTIVRIFHGRERLA